MKPCQIPCSKCGSSDISRTYRAEGESLNRRYFQKIADVDTSFRVKIDPYASVVKARKDFIEHHCRCCQFEWDSDCLSVETV